MMAGHAAIAVKSPRTMMAFVSPNVTVVTHVSKETQHCPGVKDDGGHVMMIGKHRYQISLGPEVQIAIGVAICPH